MNQRLTPIVLLAGLWIVSPASASTIADLWAAPLGTEGTIDLAVILSTTDLVADSGVKSFQIRDTTRAITIYGTNAEIDDALTGFGTGDIIEISGQTARLDGALVLVTGTVGGFAISGRSSTVPLLAGPLLIAPSDVAESHESQLACLQNVQFADIGTFAAGSDYSLVGGSAMVRIASDDLGLAGLAIPTGPVDITGIVIHTIPPGPTSDTGYRLAPRGPDDIVSVPEPATLSLLIAGLGGLVLRRRPCRGALSR